MSSVDPMTAFGMRGSSQWLMQGLLSMDYEHSKNSRMAGVLP